MKYFSKFAITLLMFIIWELSCRFIIPIYLLSSPIQIIYVIYSNHDIFLNNIRWTFIAAIIGLFLGLFLGIIFSISADAWKTTRSFFLAFVLGAQSTPIIVFYPILYLIFGGFWSKILIASLLVFVPSLIFILKGLHSIEQKFDKQFTLWQASYFERLRWYKFPNAINDIFTSAKLGSANAVIGVVVSEWLSGENGIGYIATMAMYQYDMPRLYASVMCAVTLSITIYSIVIGLETILRCLFAFLSKYRVMKLSNYTSSSNNNILNYNSDFIDLQNFDIENKIAKALRHTDIQIRQKAITIACWIPTPQIINIVKTIIKTEKEGLDAKSVSAMNTVLSFSRDNRNKRSNKYKIINNPLNQ